MSGTAVGWLSIQRLRVPWAVWRRGQVFRVWGLGLKAPGFRVEGVLKLSLRQSSLDKHT